ncbi:mitochondrial potassium channel ATP-binding subunit isoform X1 [Dendrobates tinctorius]|uniref:mitochondrial potassium channel ATP-binding subunit isoform X1 n=1 Tax=Dendrobates tinctorius TaxID=92724 RepID=UPI003CC933F6
MLLLHVLQAGLRRCPGRVRLLSLTCVSRTRPSAPRLQLYARLRDAPRRTPNKGRTLALLLGPTLTGLGVKGALCQVKVQRPPPVLSESRKPEPEFCWREFWKLLQPQLLALMSAVILAFGAALLNIQIPLILGELVNVVARYTREHAGNYLREIRAPAVKLLSLYAAQGLLTCGYIILLSRVGEQVAGSMRKSLFTSLLHQDVAFFDAQKTGLLVNRLTSDVQEFKSAFKQVISQGLRNITQTFGCFVSLYYISPKLTGLLVVVMPLLVGAGAVIGSFLRRLSRRAQEQIAKATGVADEAIGNVRTVRAFAMEDREVELYSAEVDKSAQMNEVLGIGIAVFQGLSNVALNCIVLGTIFAGGSLMAGNELSAGDLMSFLVASQTVQRSMANTSVLFGQVVRGLSAGGRVFEFMRLQPEIPLRGGKKLPQLRGEIHFSNVSFSYPTRPGQEVLSGFDLHLPPGKTVAIVGQSGGGKSTVAALVERFYDPSRGAVELDGVDIRLLDPSWLRGEVIGFINQEPVLFGTSIMENIRFGRPDASDAEVQEAAKLANADDFIRNFPDGYNTLLGERGVTLSGGQKQRVAIARALLKDPRILILDEATSALDAESERMVQMALDRASSGRTVLVIAHRLSTIADADFIVVLSKGRIAESGTHRELLRTGGLYAELIRRQSQDPPGYNT